MVFSSLRRPNVNVGLVAKLQQLVSNRNACWVMTRRLYIKVSPLGACFIINRPYLPFLAMLNLRQRLIVSGVMAEEGGSWRFRDINTTYFRVCSKVAATI